MSAATADSGATFFKAPVLLPEGPYASYTVVPTTPTGSPTSSPEPSDPSGGTGTGQSGDEPTGEPGEEPTATP
jgi:hypothetical protein